MRYYIFAANARHADYHARQLGLGGINHPDVTYVSGPEILHGVQKGPDIEFVFYETAEQHPQAWEIYQQYRVLQGRGTTGGE